jgi:membrane protease YdiL (CAAX protease family)
VLFVESCVPLSLVMTWVFHRSGQSVPLIMVLHAGINSTYTLLWPAFFPRLAAAGETYVVQLVATVGMTVILLIVTRGRLGLPRRSAAADPVAESVP